MILPNNLSLFTSLYIVFLHPSWLNALVQFLGILTYKFFQIHCIFPYFVKELLQLSSKNSLGFVELLLEEPLRVQAFFAQIRAGMWVRNGASMHQYVTAMLPLNDRYKG